MLKEEKKRKVPDSRSGQDALGALMIASMEKTCRLAAYYSAMDLTDKKPVSFDDVLNFFQRGWQHLHRDDTVTLKRGVLSGVGHDMLKTILKNFGKTAAMEDGSLVTDSREKMLDVFTLSEAKKVKYDPGIAKDPRHKKIIPLIGSPSRIVGYDFFWGNKKTKAKDPPSTPTSPPAASVQSTNKNNRDDESNQDAGNGEGPFTQE